MRVKSKCKNKNKKKKVHSLHSLQSAWSAFWGDRRESSGTGIVMSIMHFPNAKKLLRILIFLELAVIRDYESAFDTLTLIYIYRK